MTELIRSWYRKYWKGNGVEEVRLVRACRKCGKRFSTIVRPLLDSLKELCQECEKDALHNENLSDPNLFLLYYMFCMLDYGW